MLTKKQKSVLLRHKKHHSSKHMSLMSSLMEDGKSFAAAHKIAQKKVGK
tara:strand:+ start:433 stop:579 length:147 start_codon:yes stop_codon:yes gene_type:complete